MKADFVLYHLVLLSIVILLTQSLNIVWKANLFSLGHHGYFGIGAYTGILITKLILAEQNSWPLQTFMNHAEGIAILACSIVAAAFITGSIGYLTATIFTRLRNDYFAIATLIIAEVFRNLVSNWDYAGGAVGYEVPYLVVSNNRQNQSLYLGFYIFLLFSLNICLYIGLRKLMNSVYGLYIISGKDNELATELSGVDVISLQRIVFTLATAVAGVAGVIFLHFVSIVTPSDFSFLNGLPIILYVVLGDLKIGKCIIAAVCVYVAYEIIKLRLFGVLGENIGQLMASYKETFFALVLILSITTPSFKRCIWRGFSRLSRNEI